MIFHDVLRTVHDVDQACQFVHNSSPLGDLCTRVWPYGAVGHPRIGHLQIAKVLVDCLKDHKPIFQEALMNVEDRLDRLERQNMRLKGVLASLVLAATAAGLFGLTRTRSIPDVVEARAFHVIGKDGTVMVKLRSLSMTIPQEGVPAKDWPRPSVGGAISVYNHSGEHIVGMGPGGDRGEFDGQITVSDSSGQRQVRISTEFRGGGKIETFSKDGDPRLTISEADNAPYIAGHNAGESGGKLFAIDGTRGFGVFDPSGENPAWWLTKRGLWNPPR